MVRASVVHLHIPVDDAVPVQVRQRRQHVAHDDGDDVLGEALRIGSNAQLITLERHLETVSKVTTAAVPVLHPDAIQLNTVGAQDCNLAVTPSR